MEILNKASEGLLRIYTIFVSSDELKEAFVEKLKEQSAKIKIDGFRKGKVPLEVVQRLYGESLRTDSIKEVIAKISKNVIEKEELSLSFDYTVNITKDDAKGIEFELKFEVVPKFDIIDLSSIELTKHVAEITDKEINDIFDEIRKNHKNWVEKDSETSKVEEGNKVSIELRTKMNLKNRKNNIANNLDINIGDHKIMEDFWKPLINKKVGDLVNFVVNYPKNLKDKKLAGKRIEYSALIKKILEPTEYNLDDIFAKNLGYESFEKLREYAKEKAEARYNKISLNVAKRQMMEILSSYYTFDVPSNMLNVEFAEIKHLISEETKKLGKTITPKIEEGCKKIAAERVRLGFLVAEIAKRENITVSKKEVWRAISDIATLYPGHEKAVVEMYSKDMAMNTILVPILEGKVFDYLLKVVKITEKPCTVKELIALDEEEFDFFKDEEVEKTEEEKEKKAEKTDESVKSEKSEKKESAKEETPKKRTTRKKKETKAQ